MNQKKREEVREYWLELPKEEQLNFIVMFGLTEADKCLTGCKDYEYNRAKAEIILKNQKF